MGRISRFALGLSFAYVVINAVTPCQQPADSLSNAKDALAARCLAEREATLPSTLIPRIGGEEPSAHDVLRWHGGLDSEV